MQLDTAEDLVQALHVSGLFTPEQFAVLARDLSAFGPDVQGGMRYLLKRARVTHYQLGKVIRGKAADLFIGPYVVLDKLGEGGMGKVFRARHTRLDRTVALKVIRPSLVSNPTVRGRYAREVEATGKLDHPNIVRVDDAGEADGKFYMAMEFIDGIDLDRMMRDHRPLEVVEACEYTRQAALGLQHAHEAGIVHRDIKPSNIVVAGERHLPQATEPAAVKVLDLGLARAIDPDDMVAPDLTRDHTVVGTPDYMAPEQAKNSKAVDARADIYSLGCTLYFLLTGQAPFPTGNALQKLMAHQLEQPAPLQGLRPGVTAAVAEIVARAMAKKPDDRFATAGELAAALDLHARYPDESAAVSVVSVPSRAAPASPSGDAPPASTFPPFSLGSSTGPLYDLQPEPAPAPQPVAPSDATPRPRGLPDAPPVIAPRAGRGSTARPPAARRGPAPARGRKSRAAPWIVVGVALAVVVVLAVALAVWVATLEPTSTPTLPNPDPGAKPPRKATTR